MRLFMLVLAVCAVCAVSLSACGDDSGGSSSSSTPSAAAKDAVTVDIAGFKFKPASVTVKSGGTVTWTNNDSAAHTATLSSGAGAFDTGTLDQGASKKVTFSGPGTYAYICAFHPFMKGTVVVE
jgi:amicyanin